MGKKAIRKIIVASFAALATFGVLANDLLPASAPILAVELGISEAVPNVQQSVALNSGSRFIQAVPVDTTNQVETTPVSVPSQVAAPEEIQESVVVEPEPEIVSDTDKADNKTETLVPQRLISFVSDWIDISPATIGHSRLSPGKVTREVGREVGTFTALYSEPLKPAIGSRAPLFPALKASRPLLFGTIVTRTVPAQPTRAELGTLPRLSAGTGSPRRTEAVEVSIVAVKHEAKTQLIFGTAPLHAAEPNPQERIAATRQVFPIFEGPNAIDLRVAPRFAQKPEPATTVSVDALSSAPRRMFDFDSLLALSAIVEGRNVIDLNVFPKAAPDPVGVGVLPQQLFNFASQQALPSIVEGRNALDLNVFPKIARDPVGVGVLPQHLFNFASQRALPPIIEGQNATDLNVFARVSSRSGPAEVRFVPSNPVEPNSEPTFAFAVSGTSPLILEGSNGISVKVLDKVIAGPLPDGILSTISTPQRIFDFTSLRASSPVVDGQNAIDLKVFSRAVSKSGPAEVNVVSSISAKSNSEQNLAARVSPAILDGPNETGLTTVFPRIAPDPVPVNVSSLFKVAPERIFDLTSLGASSAILQGPNDIGLSVFSRVDAVPVPVNVVSTFASTSKVSELPLILQGPNDIGLAVFPRLTANSLLAVPIAVPSIAPKDMGTATALGPVPVLVTGHTAYSQAMLRPLDRQSNDLVADLLSAPDRGPSANSFVVGPDTRRAELGSAKLPTAGSPILITGQTSFSAEMLKPLNSKPAQAKPANLSTPILSAPTSGMPKQVDGYCDPKFVGDPIRFSQTVELKLEDLLNQLNARFGINFILGPNVGKIPLNVKAGSIPWNQLLRSQLFVSGVRARCINPTTIELILNRDLPTLQDEGDVTTKFVKLKFFQRTAGGTVDLANRSQGGGNGGQGGCGGSSGGQSGGTSNGGGGGGGQVGQTAGQLGNNRFDKLIAEIEKILGIRSMSEGPSGGGGARGTEEQRTNRFVTQIPGRNILVIRASDEEHELIGQIIERADRPPFQVVIKALVYSTNQDRLQDVGGQVSILGGNGNSDTLGGIFGHTIGAGTLFDFSTILGTFDFNIQFKALQQNGVISVKSRPFSTVIDGLCTTLNVGRELPIVIDSTLGGQGDVVFVNAANRLAVTPYVIDDDNGNPMAVTLEISLDANDIDSSVTTRGIPAVSRRSIQTQLLLGEDKTAILGGFTVDQDSKAISKTPGLGSIPIIGELFKRRIRDTRLSRLYFAISASIVPYGEALAPVVVPGATTDPKTITDAMKNRAEEAEKQVDTTKKKKKDN